MTPLLPLGTYSLYSIELGFRDTATGSSELGRVDPFSVPSGAGMAVSKPLEEKAGVAGLLDSNVSGLVSQLSRPLRRE